MPPPVTRPRTPAPGSSRYSAQSCRAALLVRRRPKSGVMPRETHTFSAHVDLGTLTRVDPGQFGAVGGRDRRADWTVALSYTDVVTQTACWEERSQVCDEIRLALAEVRRRTPSAVPAWGPRGTTPRLTVRGTAAGAPPPPPPPPPASLPGGSGQWTSCSTLPQCLRAVGSGPPAIHCLTALGPVGSGPPAVHCPTAWGQWGVDLLQYTAPLPGDSGQWTCCNTLPHCLGAVGSGIPAVHCPNARGQRAVDLLLYTAPLTGWGQWAVDLLQYTASPPGGSGQWTSCSTLPHCLGAAGSGPPSIHRPTDRGQWAVDLLQYTAPLLGGSGQWTSCNTLPQSSPGGGRTNLQGPWGGSIV